MGYHLASVDDHNGLIVLCVIFSVLTTGVVVTRFYARKLRGLPFLADDWLAVAGLALVLGLNGIFIAGCTKRVITGHSPVVNDFPVSTNTEHEAEKAGTAKHHLKYAFQVTEKPAFGLIKCSIVFLWRRIFGHIRKFNIISLLMIGLLTAWSLTFFFATIFQCAPDWSLNWAPIADFLTKCSNTLDMLTVFSATDVITDLMIIVMPVPMIWSLQMPVRKKIAVSGMFLVGFFTIGAGIARMTVYLVTSYEDFTIFLLWSLIEANVAVVSACLPTLLPAINKFSSKIRGFGVPKNTIPIVWFRRDSVTAKRSGSSHSNSSMTMLNDTLGYSKKGKGTANGTKTTVSTEPHDVDIELKLAPMRGILVQKDILQQAGKSA